MIIELATGSAAERRIQSMLQELMEQHDLRPWSFTEHLRIDERAYPHSHPVLTLSCGHDDPLDLLAAFVHEQLHWYEEAHAAARDQAIEATRALYPDVPADRPEGSGTESSTRLHLLVCTLELDVLRRILGEPAARAIVERLSRHHYRWVYREVLVNEPRLTTLMRDAGFFPPGSGSGART